MVGLSGRPNGRKVIFEPEKIAASNIASARPIEIATRSKRFPLLQTQFRFIPDAVTTLLRFEFSACTVSNPSRNVTTEHRRPMGLLAIGGGLARGLELTAGVGVANRQESAGCGILGAVFAGCSGAGLA